MSQQMLKPAEMYKKVKVEQPEVDEDFEQQQQEQQQGEEYDQQQQQQAEPVVAVKSKPATAASKQKQQQQEVRLEIGNKKFVTVSQFNKQTLVQIREYYEDKETGELKPGKKGIALKVAEYEQLKQLLSQVDEHVKNQQ